MRLFLLLLLTVSAPAQDANLTNETVLPASLNLHQWGAVTLFHGLPSDHVRAIAQDADGVMWFGTDGGLAKYDGRRIQTVVAEGLPDGRVRALKLDAGGTLWVGTDKGATRLVKDTFLPLAETVDFAITAMVGSEPKTTILAGEQGVIFTCSTPDPNTVQVRKFGPTDNPLLKADTAGNAPLALTSLAATNDQLLVGTSRRGLLAVKGSVVKEIVSRPRTFFITSLALDRNGQPWFGTETSADDSGLYQSRDLLHPQKITVRTGTVTALAFAQQGDLWVGTTGQGVFHFQGLREIEHFTFENSAGGLRSNRVYSIFADREGVIWFGTDRGVCRYDPQSPHVETISNNRESNFVRTVFQSPDGSLWCGTNQGLFRRELENPNWQTVEELSGKVIHSIGQDHSGRLLVGTANGLYESPKSSGIRHFTPIGKQADGSAINDSVRAICEFQGRTYIASFGHGLERLDGSQRTLIWPGQEINSLHADDTEKLWIGTVKTGVFGFDGQTVAAEVALNELNGCAVWSIEGTGTHDLWLATSRGLYWYHQGRLSPVVKDCDARCVVLGKSLPVNALPNFQPSKFVWCATAGKGLFKVAVDDRSGEHLTQTTYTKLDTEHGLPSDNMFVIFPSHTAFGDESLWIGTSRGLAHYTPGRVPPVLRATRILGKRAYSLEELQTGLTLEYPQNSLVLDLVATSSRTFPEQFQYSYQLIEDNGHRETVPKMSRDPQLLLENLQPGIHHVHVCGYTNDLIPSLQLTFSVTVKRAPFPWTSTWLSILLLLAILALWWGYQQNRKLARTNTALATANQQLADTRMQLANETENERRRIARDLHDQTLADLRRLLLLSDELPSGLSSRYRDTITPAAFRGEIEAISTEIRRICEDLSPSVLGNIGLAAALEWALTSSVAHLPAGQRFEYEFTCPDNLEERLHLDAGVEIQLYRIVQEAVNNVCRHAAAKQVRLAVDLTADTVLMVTLEDDGRGFDVAGKGTRTGRGLNNIRSRASLIDAEVSWSARAGGGTRFILRKAR